MACTSGSNSAVECDLAKVEVAGSNPVSRSMNSSAASLAGGVGGCRKQRDGDIEARYPSGKGEVCKTFMRRFESGPRLQSRTSVPAYHLRSATGWGVRTGYPSGRNDPRHRFVLRISPTGYGCAQRGIQCCTDPKVSRENVTIASLAARFKRTIVGLSGKLELRNAGGTNLSLALPGPANSPALIFLGDCTVPLAFSRQRRLPSGRASGSSIQIEFLKQ